MNVRVDIWPKNARVFHALLPFVVSFFKRLVKLFVAKQHYFPADSLIVIFVLLSPVHVCWKIRISRIFADVA